MFKNVSKIYNYTDAKYVLHDMKAKKRSKRLGKENRVMYWDMPCSFDIETSSFMDGKEKRGIMYIWQFGVNGYCFIGRTWEQFVEFYNVLCQEFDTMNTRLVVYVHNLSFEYQWIRKLLNFTYYLEVDDRKVIQALTKENVEFRCSYALSGKKLEKVSKELLKYKVEKLDTLDYKKVRTPLTPLTPEELQYCVNDVQVVMSYIQEVIEREGGITKIPLTFTGFVRREMKRSCYKNFQEYHNFISKLTLDEQLYELSKRVYAGAFVHANPKYALQKLKNVASVDEVSAYIAMIVAFNNYPISRPMKHKCESVEDFEKYCSCYACLFDITFHNLRLKKEQCIAPISESKCWGEKVNFKTDNGRVLSADKLTTSLTEQDMSVMKIFYDWDAIQVGELTYFERGYLPKQFVDVVLSLYEKKTQLKDVAGEEEQYMLLKCMLNSVYGFCSMDPFKGYSSLDDYNKSESRTTYYIWGIYITALARKVLFSGINALGRDFVYCDTDSLKFLNYNAHKAYIERYNTFIYNKLCKAMEHYDWPISRIEPLNIHGEKKQLGIWEFEGINTQFKAIRAKAYIAKKDGNYKLTLSGVNSAIGIKYLSSISKNPIDAFKDGIHFSPEHTGKTTHLYIDDETTGTVFDYNGIKWNYNELSSIWIGSADYTLNYDNDDIEEFFSFIVRVASKMTHK